MAHIYDYIVYSTEEISEEIDKKAWLEKLEKAIKDGIDINGRKLEHDLQTAISMADYEEAKILIKAGKDLDLNGIDNYGDNALAITLSTGYLWYPKEVKEKIHLLLESGIDVNNINGNGENALFACNNKEDFLLLLNKVDDIFIVNNQGHNIAYPVFHWESSVEDKIEILEILESKGIDLHKVNIEGTNYLYQSIYNETLFNYLLNKGLNAELVNNEGKTLLQYCNHETLAISLVNNVKVNIHNKDQEGKNALNALSFYPEISAILLEKGIEIVDFPDDFQNMRIFDLVEKYYIKRIEEEKNKISEKIDKATFVKNVNRI